MTTAEIPAGQHPHRPDDQGGLSPLGYKIFLDRYALKDMTKRSIAPGDTVVVVVDQKTGQREIGTVTARNDSTVVVELRDGGSVQQAIEHVDKPLETHPAQMVARVARGIAEIETEPEKQAEWQSRFEWLLSDWRFLPGGRILAAAGTEQQLTFYNCYVIPSPKDSRTGIVETLSNMMEIMSRGGGVGINVSSLRPKHAYVKGVNGRSSGAVSWGGLYSFVTGLIEQGGCFGPDERIHTDQGLIPAKELIARLESGERLYAQTHQGLRRFTATFRNGTKPLYEVTTKRGYSVRVTADHKMGVLRDGAIATVPLRNLSEGDEVLLLLGHGVSRPYVPLRPVEYDRSIMSTRLNTAVHAPSELNEDLAYFLGYMHGDGYVHVGKKVTWSAPKAVKLATADAYPEIRQRLVDIIQRLFGVVPAIEECPDAHANVAVYSRVLVEWLIQNGLIKEKAEAIRVPEAIFRSPSSVMGAFIAGYFDADGCDRGRKGGYGIDSISREMLGDVQQLLAVNGIVSHISVRDRSSEGWRTIYRLSVTGADFKERFSTLVTSAKDRHVLGRRAHFTSYPTESWYAMGIPGRYYQGLVDITKGRISYHAMSRARERLVGAGHTALAERVGGLLHTLPDTITSIRLLGDSDVYDFEVEDVHLLSGGGLYTSNSRRGALMLILNDWHPDLPEFINAKREAGKITNANISVGVSDAFMQAVEADADWQLVFPDTADPDYDTLWNGDLAAWQAQGKPVVVHRTMKAREIWNQIIESAWASAEPGVWFRDRSNQMSNSYYYEQLVCTNPCVTGDTLVYTAQGLQRVSDLMLDGRPVDVVLADGRQVRASAMFRTGRKPVYRLETVEGYSVRLTADHRVLTTRGWVEARHLNTGDRIKLLSRKGGFGTAGSEALGRLLGWLVGDGTFAGDRAVLSFFGEEKRTLAPRFAEMMAAVVPAGTGARSSYDIAVGEVTGRDEARVRSARFMRIAAEHGLVPGDKHKVPEGVLTGSEEMQRGFLQSLFTADGQVSGGPAKGTSVRLTSISMSLLRDVQRLLLNFGIASQIYQNRRGEMLREMPDGRGGLAVYTTKAQHDLVIAKDNLYRFASEIGFLGDTKQSRLVDTLASYGKRGPYREYFAARFAALVPDGEEDVYDLTEPETHSFVANGMVVHNCGEQPLPAWGICNLGAIHLAKFVTPEREVLWEDLGRAVRYGIRFLDNVIDATPYFFEENATQQQGERRVGLGTMGLGEMLIRLGIRYGSAESERFIDRLYEFIAGEAYLASAEYAAEKGAFPRFDAEKLLQSGFMQGMPERVREAVRQKGLRNVTLLTQAPTGTTGTMMDTSTGIEPYFSWTYFRKGRLGMHEVSVPVVAEWREQHPGEELPGYFVAAMDLTPEEHVRVEAAIQRWIDSSISKTANLPADYTVEQTRELYELMYRLGCKGGTVYRDSSRDEQVLMLKPQTGDGAAVALNGAASAGVPAINVTVSVTAEPADLGPGGRPKPIRVPLPDERQSITHKFQVGEQEGYITVGLYQDGAPGEVFLRVNKQGSTVSGLMESLGLLTSVALQYGVPLEGLARKMKNSRFEPYGMTGNREIPTATSLVDYVFRWLEKKFVLGEQLPLLPAIEGSVVGHDQPALALPATQTEATAPEKANVEYVPSGMGCPECGSLLHHAEGCLICRSCGYTKCG
jgi:ribonucleoside-diphosphate reductase alpha chain